MRGRPLAVLIVIAMAIVALVVVVARLGSSHPPAVKLRDHNRALILPLATSAQSPTETSVLIPMGTLGDPANTFWELFLRRPGGSSWTLSTPPGVADNGGLVLALPANGSLTAGFLTSANLVFSPVARSTDAGRSWSPGQLPAALATVPDDLAVSPKGGLLALVSRAGQTVFSSSGGLDSWRSVVSTRTLFRTVKGCGATDISAVAFNSTSQPLVGLACAETNHIGIVAGPTGASSRRRTAWQSVGPRLGNGQSGAVVVVRLEENAGGIEGLARVRSGSTSSLVAFWKPIAAARWGESSPLPIPAGWTLTATGIGGGTGGQVATALLASGTHRRVEQITAPGELWKALPTPPDGTGAVASLASETDAFVSSGSVLHVWAWTRGSQWVKTARIVVPIQYGSSS